MKFKKIAPRHIRWFIGALLGLAVTYDITAQTTASTNPLPATIPVKLETLVAEALEKNPELKFYEAEIAAAQAGRRTAGLWANPELSAEVGHKRTRDTLGNTAGEGVAWSVSLMQPFEWPGRIGLRKAIANRDLELAELGQARFKVALAAHVRELAYGLFAAQQQAQVAREVAERFQALRETLVQRDPAGLSPLLETRVIEATELTMQRLASDAELEAQAALLALNQLRGEVAGKPLVVAPVEFSFGDLKPLPELLLMAQTNNFELRVRTVELAQQGFRVELAQNERYPAIAVGPTYSEERAGERERIVGVGVSLPLPLWNRNGANVQAAKSRETQAQISLDLAHREVERQVTSAALTYQTKLREMSKWRADAVEHFRDAAEVADRHYRLGAVPVSTYVELQKQYLEAVDSLLHTKKEALSALAQLELLTGAVAPLVQSPVTEAKP